MPYSRKNSHIWFLNSFEYTNFICNFMFQSALLTAKIKRSTKSIIWLSKCETKLPYHKLLRHGNPLVSVSGSCIKWKWNTSPTSYIGKPPCQFCLKQRKDTNFKSFEKLTFMISGVEGELKTLQKNKKKTRFLYFHTKHGAMLFDPNCYPADCCVKLDGWRIFLMEAMNYEHD